MNEKLKKALKIAGIVGICALLFACGCGLGYCSAQKTGEPTKVLTERSRKERSFTAQSGITGYEFSVQTDWPSTLNAGRTHLYSIDRSNYTLTEINSWETQNIKLWGQIANQIEADYDNSRSANEQEIRFIASYYYSDIWSNNTGKYSAYFSFVMPTASVNNFTPKPFLLVSSWNNARAMQLSDNAWAWSDGNRTPYFLNYEQSQILLLDTISTSVPLSEIIFQDVQSYYSDQGYSSGYEDGYENGEAEGYEEGFEAGSGTGKMFTYLGVNPMRWYKTNLTATDQTDTSVTYRLLTFKDGQNQSWSIYAINNISDTDLDNLKINLYQGTTANSANFRTTLGTGTETTLASGIWDVHPNNYSTFAFAQIIDVYNNSLVENYFLMDGIPENATGYQMGYQKGWNDGYNASPGGQSLDNVFSIFTKAFEATASFFNMKVFGFLPIYWFFLIPIFVAIITLLMRMIKH